MQVVSTFAGTNQNVIIPIDFLHTPDQAPFSITTNPPLAEALVQALNSEPLWQDADTAISSTLFHTLAALPSPTYRLEPRNGAHPSWLMLDERGNIHGRITLKSWGPSEAERLASVLNRMHDALAKLRPLQSVTRNDGLIVDWEDAEKPRGQIIPDDPECRVVYMNGPRDLRRHRWRLEPITTTITIKASAETIEAWKLMTAGKSPTAVFRQLVEAAQ